MKAAPEMRRVTFTFRERLALVPMEVVLGPKYLLLFLVALFFLGGLGRGGYSLHNTITTGSVAVTLGVLGFLGGAAITPLLLPWLPGRPFSVKGAVVGLVIALAYAGYRFNGVEGAGSVLDVLPWFFILPAVAAFFAMNFTGASTYTSLSGVKREMRFAVPAQVAGLLVGMALWVVGHFV